MTDTDSNRLRLDEREAGGRTFSRSSLVVLALVVGLYSAARLSGLTASCLWFDEIFSVHAARHTWREMLRFVAADVIHPPLFYALLKAWVALGGESLLWLRLLPALVAVACIVPFLLLCRELRLRAFETNLALMLLAANGYLIKYAQELRMYSLLLLLTLCSLWLFVRFFNAPADDKDKKSLAALFVVNLLLVYTHYYGWLVVLSELVFLALRGRRKLLPFLLTVALLFLCFGPWVYALARGRAEQGRGVEQNLGWVERPRAGDAAQFLTLLHEPFYFRQSSDEPLHTRFSAPLGLLLFGLPVLLLLWRLARRGRGGAAGRADGFRWLLIFSLLPVVLAFALSWALPQSIWGTRHLIVSAAPYLILVAAAVSRVRPSWLRATLLGVVCCWFFWGALVAYSRRGGDFVWCAWESLALQLARAETTSSTPPTSVVVYAFEDLVAYHLWFALDAARDERFKVTVIKGVRGLSEDPAYFIPRAFDGVSISDAAALEGEHFWIAFRDAAWNEARPPLKNLKDRGYTFEEVYEFDAQGQRAFIVSVRRG